MKKESKPSENSSKPLDHGNLLRQILLAPDESRFDIGVFCFKEQLALIQDSAKFKTAVCSRRSGKTVACAAHLVHDALQGPRRVSLYITLNRINAKRILWAELLSINARSELGAKTNETELSFTFPNGSVIYLSGAKDKSEIEKFRGLALSLVYIDESQSFRAYLQELVDDVLSKALFDFNGQLVLIGTPGPVPAGYFYDCAHSPKWSHHGWTMFQNPFLPQKAGCSVQSLIEQDCERMGVPLSHPKIQRESFGKWIVDQETLVFQYSEARNGFHAAPQYPIWEVVLGVDIGFEDSDAIAVLGWSPHEKHCYLLEECVTPKQGVTELASQIERLAMTYKPIKIVMDTGGLGKKIAEEITRRHEIPIQAAEKVRKFEYIELLNDALRTKRFFAKPGSRFAQDSMLVEWDRDNKNPEKLKISDRYHSDICDAVLYAYREALHWLSVPEKEAPKPGTNEWFSQEVRKMEELAEEQVRKSKESEDWFDFPPESF